MNRLKELRKECARYHHENGDSRRNLNRLDYKCWLITTYYQVHDQAKRYDNKVVADKTDCGLLGLVEKVDPKKTRCKITGDEYPWIDVR